MCDNVFQHKKMLTCPMWASLMKEKTQKKTPKRTKLSSDTGSHVVNGKLMLQPKNRSTYQCPGINFTLEIQQQFSHLHIATMSSNMQRRQIVLTQCTHKWTLLTSTLNKLWCVPASQPHWEELKYMLQQLCSSTASYVQKHPV